MNIVKEFKNKKWKIYVWEKDGIWEDWTDSGWLNWKSGQIGRAPIERAPFSFEGVLIPNFDIKYHPADGRLLFIEAETQAKVEIAPSSMRDLVKCLAEGYITPENGGLRGFWEFQKSGSKINIVPIIP